MGFFWFLIAVVFFVLWLSVKSAKTKSDKEHYDKGYSEGYWTLGKVVSEQLSKKTIDRKVLATYVAQNDSTSTIELTDDAPGVDAVDTPVEEEVPFLEQAIVENRQPAAATQTAVTQTPVVSAPVKTKQQIAERNLNILLYMASFLIVAAAAAFIATSMPPLVRLAGLWLVIIAFYGVGLLLHAKVTYLKPAATAFIGTGLALIPFAGIALSQLGGMSAGWAWFLTSVVGVISYAIATLQLRSEVVGYLTVAFSLSFATSTVATVSGPVVYYFVALIAASLLFHILSRTNVAWIPELFKRPITQTSQLLTPVTLVASLLAYDTMTVASYQIVFWTATAYYLVLWVTEKRTVFEQVFRVLVSISAYLSIANIYNFDVTPSLFAVLAIATVQALYSFVRVKLGNVTSRTIEMVWLGVVMFALIVTLPVWIATDSLRLGLTTQVLLITTLSVAAAVRFRLVYFGVPALIASLALPFILGRWPGEEVMSLQWVTWTYAIAAALILAVSFWLRQSSAMIRSFFQLSFWFYIFTTFNVSFFQGSTVAFIFSSLGVIALTLVASYLYRLWLAEAIPALLLVPVVALSLREFDLPTEWMNIATIGITTAFYAVGLGAHHFYKEDLRRNLLVIASIILGFGLVFSYNQSEAVSIVALFLALFYAVISLLFRSVLTSKVLKGLFSLAYVVYPLVMLLIASGVEIGWVVLAFTAITTIYWIGSYVERVPAIMAFGNLALIGLVCSAWSWLKFDMSWFSFGVAWIVAGVYYLMSLVYAFKLKGTSRYYINLIFTWVVLGFVTLLHLGADGRDGYAAAGTLIAIAGTIAVHGYVLKRTGFVEAAIYIATFALQRIAGNAVPELNIALYGHWWAITLLLVALWRKDAQVKLRLIIATACVTVGSGVMALASGGNYQILFLVEHVGLLVAGVLARASWALWWGLAASVLAVLYFLRSSLFLSLLFLGLTLLGIVIWRLKRANSKK